MQGKAEEATMAYGHAIEVHTLLTLSPLCYPLGTPLLTPLVSLWFPSTTPLGPR